jgi:hypothetical protein
LILVVARVGLVRCGQLSGAVDNSVLPWAGATIQAAESDATGPAYPASYPAANPTREGLRNPPSAQPAATQRRRACSTQHLTQRIGTGSLRLRRAGGQAAWSKDAAQLDQKGSWPALPAFPRSWLLVRLVLPCQGWPEAIAKRRDEGAPLTRHHQPLRQSQDRGKATTKPKLETPKTNQARGHPETDQARGTRHSGSPVGRIRIHRSAGSGRSSSTWRLASVSAISTSFTFNRCDVWRSTSNASAADTPCRSIRMPFA